MINVKLWGQLKQAAGTSTVAVDFADGITVADVIRAVADQGNDQIQKLLLNDDSSIRLSTLVFINDEQIATEDSPQVADGAKVTLMTPIAGG